MPDITPINPDDFGKFNPDDYGDEFLPSPPLSDSLDDPGDTEMEIYTEGASLPDIMKRIDPEQMEKRINKSVLDELRLLGEKLVREVYKNTPKASGALARSTKYRILPTRSRLGGAPTYQLDVIQDATGRQDVQQRYFYWYTVHHGLQPAGRLRQARPPSDEKSLLTQWTKRVVATLDPEYTTGAIAWNIHKFGIKPNPYLRISFQNKQKDIQETSQKIGQAIIFDLNELPDVQHHYGRSRRGF